MLFGSYSLYYISSEFLNSTLFFCLFFFLINMALIYQSWMLPHSHLVLYCCIWKSTNHISQAPLPAALLLDSVIKRHLWDFKVRGNVTFSAFGLHSSRYYSFWNLLVMRGLWYGNYILSSVQLSHVQLFATPWIAARQDSLSITNSQSSLRLMSIESVMPSSSSVVPFSSCSQSLPASEFFPVSQLFTWGCQSIYLL